MSTTTPSGAKPLTISMPGAKTLLNSTGQIIALPTQTVTIGGKPVTVQVSTATGGHKTVTLVPSQPAALALTAAPAAVTIPAASSTAATSVCDVTGSCNDTSLNSCSGAETSTSTDNASAVVGDAEASAMPLLTTPYTTCTTFDATTAAASEPSQQTGVRVMYGCQFAFFKNNLKLLISLIVVRTFLF